MYAKLTYFLACMALLASCGSPESPDSPAWDMDRELTFDVASLSRATVTTSFSSFAVYGDMVLQGDPAVSPVVIFSNTAVQYSGGAWRYEGTQYWMPKYEHSFVAVSPLSAADSGSNPQYSKSKLSFTYSLPTDTEGMLPDYGQVDDIIAATHRRLYDEADENGTTTFQFSHILSLINVAPAFDDNIFGAGDYIEFHKIELSGFNTRARFSITPAPLLTSRQTDDRTFEVKDHEGSGTLTVSFSEPKKILNDRKNVSLFEANDAIIMLPQQFASDSEAKIRFYYTVNGDPTEKMVSLQLKNQKWETGKRHTYRFTIERSGPHFETTAITDWDEMSLGNIDAH